MVFSKSFRQVCTFILQESQLCARGSKCRFKQKEVLFTSSELLFTLSCRITQVLLDTHTNICTITSKLLYTEVGCEFVDAQEHMRETMSPPGRTLVCICHQGSFLASDRGEAKPNLYPVPSLQQGREGSQACGAPATCGHAATRP